MDGANDPRPVERTVVFLHGLGDGPRSWDAQIAALPLGWAGLAPALPGLTEPAESFDLDRAADSLYAVLDGSDLGEIHLCGLSLGAMVATRLAIDHPDRWRSVVICAGQDRPSPRLLQAQQVLLKALPERLVAPPGMSKTRMLSTLHALSGVDMRSELAEITARTLVLCGARDVANRPAARRLAAGIPGADFHLVANAGHQVNAQQPAAFNHLLRSFHAKT